MVRDASISTFAFPVERIYGAEISACQNNSAATAAADLLRSKSCRLFLSQAYQDLRDISVVARLLPASNLLPAQHGLISLFVDRSDGEFLRRREAQPFLEPHDYTKVSRAAFRSSFLFISASP